MRNNDMENLEYGEYFPEVFEYLDCIPPWENIPQDFETTETAETAKNTIKEITVCVTFKI